MPIYVLALEHGKFYVGMSDDVKKRVKQHFDGLGSFWTKKHKPLEHIKTYKTHGEDYHVIKMMYEHGIQNVRGGSFSKLQLTSSDVDLAKRMMRTQYNLCYKCGKPGHFTRECKRKQCDRCGRNNHNTENCYAKTTVDGAYLFDEASDDDFVLISSESDDFSSDDDSSTGSEIKPPTSWYDIGVGVASFIGGFMSAMDD
tara:strand:+ start:31325 stop:31921 length:597 start_codon:yes stop_codon:yes gene_type:complete